MDPYSLVLCEYRGELTQHEHYSRSESHFKCSMSVLFFNYLGWSTKQENLKLKIIIAERFFKYEID